ncbi:MAG: 30S ribosomal protein S7 [Planctomycetales bacterium]|nr:30S ribosomal protein S7 [Planctomycetales bacterium]
MPRSYVSTARFLKPDSKYGSLVLSKFINAVMEGGKKTVAERIVYGALDILKQKVPDQAPIEVFNTALGNVKPQVEVRSRRVGGATYQVPIPVSRERQTTLAFRWIRDSARKRKGKPMSQRLAEELSEAFRNEGNAIKTRENIHKMAEANKAFAHFAAW